MDPLREMQEQEANRFAIELLMPAEWIERDLDGVEEINISDDVQVAELARRYRVGVALMTFRLIELGKIPQHPGLSLNPQPKVRT